ncbi:MAG: signal peptidase II [Deltaproteobacteria bacterium]|nr:signal peptidase II [Deltaproteobacteria bacterium]MBI4373533.1 signal peptidase II [Deltaproteobacteria bacterium]
MKRRFKILFSIASLVILIDQFTKFLVVMTLQIGEKISVIPGLFDIVHIRNPGAAFGSFADLPDAVRLPFFFITSSVALVILLVYFIRAAENQRSLFLSLSLILGGAIANISDRILRGNVVDFLSFHWHDNRWDLRLGDWRSRIPLEWPAFNIADAAISVAALWMMLLMVRKKS